MQTRYVGCNASYIWDLPHKRIESVFDCLLNGLESVAVRLLRRHSFEELDARGFLGHVDAGDGFETGEIDYFHGAGF